MGCHVATNSFGGFDFNQPHFGIWSGQEEVNFKALMIPEKIQFFSHSGIGLVLQDFCCNKAFEESPQERRAFELGRRCYTQQITGKTGVFPIILGLLTMRFPKFSKYGGTKMI